MAIDLKSPEDKRTSALTGRVIKVGVADILVRDRHRQDMGDLKALADSIRVEGLLQPIGITEDNVLVFGERRLRAVDVYLKAETIDARIVNVTSIVAGEFAENDMRKAFTPSERLAIAEAVQQEIGKRQGGDRKSIDFQSAQSGTLKGKTRDLAAKQSGFTSHQQMERTAKVVALGAPKVVASLDAGKVAVSKAADLVNLPKPEQVVALDGAKAAREDREAAEQSLRLAIQAEVAEGGSNAYTDFVLKHGKRPDRQTAADIGKLLGRQVKADDGSMQPPKSKAQKDADSVQRSADKAKSVLGGECARVALAVANLGANGLDPAQVAQSIDRWQRPTIVDNLDRAVEWLNGFAKEWRRAQADNH